MYQEINPSEGLNDIIDSFWLFSKNNSSETFNVLPDTCADLIFNMNQNNGFLSGVMSHSQRRELSTESNLIGVRFKIEKFASLCKIPLSETKNLRVNLSQIFLPENLNRLNQLAELETTVDKINFLENFVLTSLKQNYEKQDRMILSVAQRIRLLHGIINIEDLANSYHISLRQLERRFKRYIGLTIKEFSNIVRFNYAKKTIETCTKTSLLEIAFDMGFFDHSHMTYEFKRISGENPSCFR